MSGTASFGARLNECVQTSGHDSAWPAAEQVGADHAYRYPIEPHLAVEWAGSFATIHHVRTKMVLQIAADRQIGNDADASLP